MRWLALLPALLLVCGTALAQGTSTPPSSFGGTSVPGASLPGTGLPGTSLPGAALPGQGASGTGVPGMGVPDFGLPGLGTGGDAGAGGSGAPPSIAPGGIVPRTGIYTGTNPLPLPGTTPPQAIAPGGIVPKSGIYVGTGPAPLPGSSAPFTCPTFHGARLLVSSHIYDGPPLNGTLMPDRNGIWHLPPHDWPGHAYYLSCDYGYDRPPLGIRLPQHVRSCKRPTGDPTQVTCR